ncbi:hypothetical protein [Pseudoroseicyclus tamaricis]|uniref:Uncharacterized protein n=1 Tax=Pseudoroseicyclus tamaricis TaxID=2705421 RepID=A0A6B2JF49_9RHOB|nr:hypothetical protein [Pseudoroseicyclus tamaricis]NDU99610.1 hypothetical protein [Pseudoroseicyclus tamaricis]
MAPDANDASYPFVREANRKKALNSKRQERARNQGPWWNVFAACLLASLTIMYIHDGDTGMAIIFGLFAVQNGFFAYTGAKKRRSLS